MIDKIIELNIEQQIDRNNTDLELLNMQLEFYEKLLKSSTTKREKNRYQNKINDLYKKIATKINDNIELF